MRKIHLIWILVLFATLTTVSAEEFGCCCQDNIAQKGSLQMATDCEEGYIFTEVQSFPITPAGTICQEFCGQVTGPEIPFVSQKCDDPKYNPPPRAISVIPVRGRSQMHLIWDEECPVSGYTVERCEGTECTDFEVVASIGPGTSFIDPIELKWENTYTYRMKAHYVTKEDSLTVIAEGNTGDIECGKQFTETAFCISPFYYEQYQTYLQTNGYRTTEASAFTDDFAGAVLDSFFYTFNRAYHCDERNKLIDNDPNCQEVGGVCVADENGVDCLEESDCKVNPDDTQFGLGYTQLSCEGTGDTRNFCFYDRSSSLVNTCYSCKTFMNCYDYKSEAACNKDNCAVGECSWVWTYEEIGVGVCVDQRFNNCPLCDEKGTTRLTGESVESIAAYNEIYDQCSKAKSDALSTEEFPCFFDAGGKSSKGCDTVTCLDYSRDECGSPAAGISLDENNAIAERSTDQCGIGVCEWFDVINECAKNADGTENAGGDKRDCGGLSGEARIICEEDVVPPRTTLRARGEKPGQTDYIDLIITDQERRDKDPFTIAADETYPVHMCTYTFGGTPCSDYAPITKGTLNLNNLELKIDEETIAELAEGPNVIRFYGEDPAHNLEEVQEFVFAACAACQGPKLIELTIDPGNVVDDVLYTSSRNPTITAKFNTDTQITVAMFISKDDGEEYELETVSVDGTEFTLRPQKSLPEEPLTLRLFGRSTAGVEMEDAEERDVVVDSTAPSVSLSVNGEPMSEQTLESSSASVEVKGSEGIIIEDAKLVTRTFTDFAAIEEEQDISFSASSDGTTHTSSVSGAEGRNEVRVTATDYAGNGGAESGAFYIHTEGPIFRLKEPSFGVAASIDFPLEIETHNPATCTFWFNPIQPIPPADQKAWEALTPTTGGRIHSKDINGDVRGISFDEVYEVNVYCYDDQGRDAQKTFSLSIDNTPPTISFAEADPNPIAETPFTTTFTVVTDDLTFCKYSDTTEDYESMEGEFPEFEIEGRTDHTVDITVESIASYSYNIACKNLAELGPARATIAFSVDADAPLTIEPNFPLFSGATDLTFSVKTNKKAFCFYEAPDEDIQKSTLGDSNLKRTHEVDVSLEPGEHNFIVTCSTGQNTIGGVPETKEETITFYIDTTPPRMAFVDDSSPLPDNPEKTFYRTRLQVKFNGEDDETKVTKYHVKVMKRKTQQVIAEKTYGEEVANTAFFIEELELEDETEYSIEVTPENVVGLIGEPMESDGVTTDFSLIPPTCNNGVLDPEEADEDCGGVCLPCAEGRSCQEGDDCESKKCVDNICAAPSCKDNVHTPGFESDVDCGGQCIECGIGEGCEVDTDCITDFCSPAGTCQIPGPCNNKIQDGSETDIDCGGSCATKCGAGRNCVSNSDCESNAACVDVPHLGVKKCKVFPEGMKDSDGDGIPDEWEIRNGLDPNNPNDGNEDPDNDGLTNKEEYEHKTDPFNEDTDGDGWKDGIEVSQGFDPLDPNSHPTGWWFWLLVLLGILLLLGLLAYGGWAWYEYTQGKKKDEEEEKRRAMQKKPAPTAKAPSAIERLRGLRPGEEKKKEPFEGLRDLALSRFSESERKQIARQLKLLAEGKLSRAERDELFRKLRITAQYYEKHKGNLQKQFERWMSGKKTRTLKEIETGKRVKRTKLGKPKRKKKK